MQTARHARRKPSSWRVFAERSRLGTGRNMTDSLASTNGTPTANSMTAKLLEQWGKVKVAQYLTALTDTKAGMEQERRKWKAEEEAAHLALWGKPMAPAEDGDMGDTILGDVTHIQQAAQGVGLGKILMTAAVSGLLGTGVGVGGLALVNMLMNPDTDKGAYVDDSLDVGLGRIEDYFKQDAK